MTKTRSKSGRTKRVAVPIDASARATRGGVNDVVTVPVVGIGASAGGLAAFEAFFSAMPTDHATGMAFVLIQHLAPEHVSYLGEIIRRHTSMPVSDVTDRMPVEADHVYVIPPGHDLVLSEGTLLLCESQQPRGHGLPIDRFFRSLAAVQRERAICVVLSGSGSDGALGVRAIKAEDGMAMAQAADTAEFQSMPASAVATGLVDYVLQPAEMPAQLLAYAAHAFERPARASKDVNLADAPELLAALCNALRGHSGHDFSGYKTTTIARRVERRMALHQCRSAEDYLTLLQSDAREAEALFNDILIGVTSFFRDPEAFAVLATEVVPKLVAGKHDDAPIRVWCCGCSTGEEAYSLAIVLHEHLAAQRARHPVQIFASDLDRHAIAQARLGVFSESIAVEVSPERLARYFIHDAERGVYTVQRSLRDLVVFSEHDVVQDPPFSRVDLVTCRNVLIYMGAALQRRVLGLFHYALLPDGVLFLGSSESTSDASTSFSTLDGTCKLYRRAATGVMQASASAVDVGTAPRSQRRVPVHRMARPSPVTVELRQIVEVELLKHFASVAVLTKARGEVLYVHGRTGKFLELAAGDVGTNLLAMAREGLRQELSLALHRAATKREVVHSRGLRIRSDGDQVTADLTVRPVLDTSGDAAPQLFVVILKEVDTPAASSAVGPASSAVQGRVAVLETQLAVKDEYLQSALDETELANQELQATSEEMQSVNEELQSTNEELETSKEELQAVNEELITVNAELQIKVADLSRANNDMNNLLAGTGVATLFVDLESRIARVTPEALQLINLIPSDVGRPVEHVVSNLVGYQGLGADIGAVLDRLTPVERQVETKAGAWFLMRIRPYRTLENAIEGAVITFVDITERQRIEDELRRSRDVSDADLDAMTRLQRVGALFVGELSLPRVLDEILDAALAITGASKASIRLLDPASNRLAMAAQRGFAPEWVTKWEGLENTQGPSHHALETKQRVIVDDVETYIGAGVRALQATPLIGRADGLIGVLATYYEVPHSFASKELRLLDLLGRQVTDIIERWRSDEALGRLEGKEPAQEGTRGHGQ